MYDNKVNAGTLKFQTLVGTGSKFSEVKLKINKVPDNAATKPENPEQPMKPEEKVEKN